ncbi:MAG TPA: hypothetical protein VMT66_18230 [Steroidobacteraceae bacterium]|nr:hypothetical protein [Steroidobacteraceae bacterium]
MVGQWRVLALLVTISAATGCVPIPYKPSAGVNHVPVMAEEAGTISLTSGAHRALIEPLVKSIQHAEPRIVVIDGSPDLVSLTAGQGTLAGVLHGDGGSGATPGGADYLLCVGSPVHRQLHDTGAAAPFPYFPLIWVGYEKVQSRDSVVASLVDLHARSAESLEVSTTYSEVIVAAVYGFATIARPQAALRDRLAADVAHELAAARPVGAIRLMVVAQEGGTVEPGSEHPSSAPRRAVAEAEGAGDEHWPLSAAAWPETVAAVRALP